MLYSVSQASPYTFTDLPNYDVDLPKVTVLLGMTNVNLHKYFESHTSEDGRLLLQLTPLGYVIVGTPLLDERKPSYAVNLIRTEDRTQEFKKAIKPPSNYDLHSRQITTVSPNFINRKIHGQNSPQIRKKSSTIASYKKPRY